MIPIDGQPILTVAHMRAAEEAAIAAGSSVEQLMERAGAGVAEAVRRLAAGAQVLILCGPGNNGGDGYVAARILKTNGVDVRVAGVGEPKTAAAMAARKQWDGKVDGIDAIDDDPRQVAPVMVDAVFGSGLSRNLDDKLADRLDSLIGWSRLAIAVDLPSGIDTDSGAAMARWLPRYDVTLALGAVKPAHVSGLSAHLCGEVRLIDLGLRDVRSQCRVLARPHLGPPMTDAHKYSRGMVVVIGGSMPGAAALAATAAIRAGAGYALLLTDHAPVGLPHAIVQRPWSVDALDDALAGKKAASIVVGPGLGRDKRAEQVLDAALGSDWPLVIDGDALHLLDATRLRTVAERSKDTVLTPHAGEFRAVFGDDAGGRIDAARRAADRSGATIVFKGADTVIAHPDGTATAAPPATSWLSTAGTGDVLAGAVGAMLAAGSDVDAAVWMHAEAARRLGGAFVADDLARELSAVRASL